MILFKNADVIFSLFVYICRMKKLLPEPLPVRNGFMEKSKNMDERTISQGTLLNRAAVAGLALGAVSTAYLFITQYLPEIIGSAVAVMAVDALLWFVKFIGCIFLMRLFMQRLVQSAPEAGSGDSFRLGMFASLFSALIYSGAYLAFILYVAPGSVEEMLDTVTSQYSSMLDSNSLASIDSMTARMPQITFFSNLIYCFLYGTLLSAILSRYIPQNDPFADFRNGNGGRDEDVEEQ